MKDTAFSKFIKRLYSIVGGEDSKPEFTRNILSLLVTEDSEDLIKEGHKDETFRSYFNGGTNITKIARIILSHVYPYRLIEYLNGFSDDTTDYLIEEFKNDILIDEEINQFNICEEIVNLLLAIVKNAATRKNNDETNAKSEFVEAEIVDDDNSGKSEKAESQNVTIIKQQTNIVQNGQNSVSLVNNGTIKIDF